METWLYVDQKSYFTLSPATRLVFSADADVFVDQDDFARRTTFAKISAVMETSNNGVWAKESFSQSLNSRPDTRTQFLSGFIQTGANSGTGVMTAEARSSLYHYGDAMPPSPVPEPATYGMLAVGLMVLGGAVRRKARSA
jgi:hypothetical protein